MKSERFERRFQNVWKHTNDDGKHSINHNFIDGLDSFYDYCKQIWEDLSYIDEFGRTEKKEFEFLSGDSVKNYIKLITKYFDDINNLIFDKDEYNKYKEFYKSSPSGFISCIGAHSFNPQGLGGLYRILNRDACILGNKEQIIGLKDKYYKKVNRIVNNIFIMEKFCSSVCKKIWEKHLTKIEDLDFSKSYKIIVKHIYTKGWRKDRYNSNVQNFLKFKKYQSASLISNKNNSNYFNFDKYQTSALLIYEPDVSKIVCANFYDGYTEEFINDQNPCRDKENYTDINKIETIKRNNKKHTLYALSTKISTPNSLLWSKKGFNEVLMREPKVVGVLAVNKRGKDFAQETAKKLKVPYYGILRPRVKEPPNYVC